MFKNSGGKLKGLAKFVFILSIVISGIFAIIELIAAISFFTQANRYNGLGAVGGLFIFLMIITLALGVILGWLSSIKLYARGQEVEDVQKIREILEFRVLEKPAAKPETYNYFTDSPINTNNNGNAAFGDMFGSFQQNQQYQNNVNSSSCCSRCGTPYIQGETFCRNCGNSLR